MLAVDVGGTKLAAALVDREGVLLWNDRTPTPPGAEAENLWGAVRSLLGRLPEWAAPEACGIACGGPMSPGGEMVSPLNIPGWRDFPLKGRLAELTRLPTWLDNDAKALALAEGWVGTAIGEPNYLAMVVSTGVGGGIVLDGRILEGRTGNAGHIGHLTVQPGGRLCGCGARGCLEGEASGKAIEAVTGRPPAEAPGEVAERTGTMVGRAIASVANLLDLRLAVVSGSVALGFGEPFFAAANAEVEARCKLSFSAGCRVLPSSLGTQGSLVGAAAVAWRGLAGG